MPDLLSYLNSSDTIKITKVEYDYIVDPSVIDPGSILVYDICPLKPAGTLLMDFALNQFGFLGLDFHASIKGNDAGLNANGEPLVRWEVDQKVDKFLPDLDATIGRITGHFTTILTPIDPAVKQKSCQGTDRYYAAILATTGMDNGFILRLHKTIYGRNYDGTVKVTNFSLDGIIGNPLELAVKIFTPADLCANPVVEGGIATSFAVASGIPLGVQETYQWKIEGGVSIGPTDQWIVKYTTPTMDPVQVSVTVKADDQIAFNSESVFVISKENPKLLAKICRLRTIIKHNWFFDPLRRNFRSRPLTTNEIQEIAGFAEQISEVAKEILNIIGPARK